MSTEIVLGDIAGVDAERLTVGSTAVSLTSAKYAKINKVSRTAYISCIDNNEIFIVVLDPTNDSLPANVAHGVLWKKDFGPFKFRGDLSRIRMIRNTTDATVNVMYTDE